MAESVAGILDVVPGLGDSRSARAVASDLSATDGAESRATSRCGAGCGVTVLEGSGALLDSREGCAGVEGVSPRRASRRSSSELRERLPCSEALGADACGVRPAALSAPIRLPILLVPLEPGESLCRGTDNVLDDSDLGEPIGAPMRPESRTLGLGVLTDGRDGLTVIDRPEPDDGLEGADGAGLLELMDGLDGALGVDLLMLGVDGRSLMACSSPERRLGTLGAGADRTPIDGLERLTAGGLLRTLGARGACIWGLGAGRDGGELNDGLRLGIELPRLEIDGDGAAGARLGAGAGADRDDMFGAPREDRLWAGNVRGTANATTTAAIATR